MVFRAKSSKLLVSFIGCYVYDFYFMFYDFRCSALYNANKDFIYKLLTYLVTYLLVGNVVCIMHVPQIYFIYFNYMRVYIYFAIVKMKLTTNYRYERLK